MRPHYRLFAALAGACLLAGGALAQQATSRATGLKLNGDEPIQIESDKLEVRDAEGTAIFTGNVNVVQGTTLMKSGRMKVFYAKNSGAATPAAADAANQIDRIEVDDEVYVKTETQVATSDKASFDMKSEILVMTGDEVVLTDGPNVIVGCKLTVHMATGEAHLDGCGKGANNAGGRVKMLLQPKSQSQ